MFNAWLLLCSPFPGLDSEASHKNKPQIHLPAFPVITHLAPHPPSHFPDLPLLRAFSSPCFWSSQTGYFCLAHWWLNLVVGLPQFPGISSHLTGLAAPLPVLVWAISSCQVSHLSEPSSAGGGRGSELLALHQPQCWLVVWPVLQTCNKTQLIKQ